MLVFIISSHFHKKPLCYWDNNAAPVRFYEIHVRATDYSSNWGSAKSYVIVLPRGYRDTFQSLPGFGSLPSLFIDMVTAQPPQNQIVTTERTWINSGDPLPLPALPEQGTIWYVRNQDLKCVANCTESGVSELCGGIVHDLHVRDVFASPQECCSKKLDWMVNKCFASSMNY